jgi:hypothetical protein
MVRRAIVNLLVVAAAGCSPAGEAGNGTEPPPSTAAGACAVDADCADASVCTADACLAGACTHAYLSSTATAILSGSPAGALLQLPIPTTSQTVSGVVLTGCPGGSDPLAVPPVCVLEADLTSAALAFEPLPDGSYRISGTVPVRAQRVPVRATAPFFSLSGDVTVTGNGGCPGSVQTFATPSATVTFSVSPVDGTLVASAVFDSAQLAGAVTPCGSATFASLASQAVPLVGASLAADASGRVAAVLAPQLCLTAPCPAGTVDDGGTCRLALGGPCVARGTDPATGLLVVPACAQ